MRVLQTFCMFHTCIAGFRCIKKMGPAELFPPSSVRGMTVLDKEAFKTIFKIPYIHVPTGHLNEIRKKKTKEDTGLFKKMQFKFPKIPPIRNLPDEDGKANTHKIFLLDLGCIDGDQLRSDLKQSLCEVLKEEPLTVYYEDIVFTYENWNYDQILAAILPSHVTGVGGFAQVGHIVHLNLKPELETYKHIIGQVLLDKVSCARTVVNKLTTIHNTYRYFDMEVLAGDDDLIAVVKEYGLTFKMDFSKVYWNSKLGYEHRRVVEELRAGDVVFDVFAGIGPFAVPAAKKKMVVFANDLNPESVKWLKENIALNKAKTIHVHNLDGREFLVSVFKPEFLTLLKQNSSGSNVHIIMNLPDIAIEFLDAFVGLLSDVSESCAEAFKAPIVHCYCFSKADDMVQDVTSRIEAVMQWKLPGDAEIKIVRNVAPNKEMLCATFRLDREVMCRHKANSEEPPVKRTKESE